MSVVVFYFMAAAIRYIFIKNGLGGLFSIEPFYNPDSFSLGAVGSATALAALTYIGFDGLTTLSEEVKNPKRNVMLAAVLTCLITGVWSGAQIYLAQLSWPDWASFTEGLTSDTARNSALDTAIMTVAHGLAVNYWTLPYPSFCLSGVLGQELQVSLAPQDFFMEWDVTV